MILYQTSLVLSSGSAEVLARACCESPVFLEQWQFCPCRVKGMTVRFAEISAGGEGVSREKLKPLLLAAGADLQAFDREEMGVNQLMDLLAAGIDEGFLDSEELRGLLERNHLFPFANPQYSSLLGDTGLPPETAVLAPWEDMLSELNSRAAREELARIQALKGVPFYGYPAVYLVHAATEEEGENLASGLLAAFYRAGVLKGRFGALLRADECPIPEKDLREIYLAEQGASVTVRLGDDGSKRGAVWISGEPDSAAENLQTLTRLAEEHRRNVLTVFVAIGGQGPAVKQIRTSLRIPLIEITADGITREEARALMAAWAGEAGIPLNGELADTLPLQPVFRNEEEVSLAYSRWLNRFLSRTAYPQYAFLPLPRAGGQENAASSAEEKLAALIGLEEVKEIIAQATDYAAAQRLYEERGLSAGRPCLHMVFTGNPGTAKTTVARLVAQIYRDRGVLSRGDLIEVGRGDLIGKYVGWTAQQVQDKFRKARGSVLFIDEAYSLLEAKEGTFGDEALNTIVQEMENCREDTVVILAGYREPMRQLVERNPGLQSRIAFTVDFPDYRDEELLAIARKVAGENKRKLARVAEEKLLRYFAAARREKNFGNGRCARALIEKALIRQASRLMRQPSEAVSDESIRTLIPEDFPAAPKGEEAALRRPIGFAP